MRPGKAVAKAIKDRYHAKIDASEIGNILAQSRIKYDVRVRVTLGCDGEASEYYHSKSCYWGEYSASRDYIEYNGGGAIRLYDQKTNDLMGRAWFLPVNDGIVLFNAYGANGFDHIDAWGALVAKAFEEHYKVIRFDVLCDESFYLNTGRCVFIGDIAKMPDTYDYEMKEPPTFKYASGTPCTNCGNIGYSSESLYYVEDGNYVCENCFENYYVYIEEWDEYHHIDYCVCVRHGQSSEWFHEDSENIVKVDSEYYHIDDVIEDVDGDYHIVGEDTYFICNVDGNVYPICDAVETHNGLIARCYMGEEYELS